MSYCIHLSPISRAQLFCFPELRPLNSVLQVTNLASNNDEIHLELSKKSSFVIPVTLCSVYEQWQLGFHYIPHYLGVKYRDMNIRDPFRA